MNTGSPSTNLSRRHLFKGAAGAGALVLAPLTLRAERAASDGEMLDRYLAWLDAEASWLQWAAYPQLRGRYVPTDYVVTQHFDDTAVRWAARQRAIPMLQAAGVSLAPDMEANRLDRLMKGEI